MDETDLRIALELIKNGRIKKSKLAKIFGVTETAIRKRIEKLEKSEAILGYRAVLNFKKFGLFSSLTGIDVDPERLWSVVEKLKEFKNVISLFLTSGDHVIMVEVVCDSMREMIAFHEQIEKIEGVKRVCPAIIVEVVK
ncbi:MAG: Lrp/AsnC family transcriptional regulator [Archaeoglobaceae archaeon]